MMSIDIKTANNSSLRYFLKPRVSRIGISKKLGFSRDVLRQYLFKNVADMILK